jgi:hypothetical protein
MKVTGSGGVGRTGQAKGARPAGSGVAFTPIRPGGVAETNAAAGARAVTAVSSLDALLALQDVGGPLERRRRAVSRAGRLLDSLDEVRLAVLDGAVTPAILERLARGVREQRESTDDPRLEGLLGEIEMRAGVELAKLEMAGGAT